MMRRVARIIRSIRMRRRFLVIFIPCDQFGDSDAVAALAPRLRRRINRRHLNTQVDQFVDSFGEVAQESGLERPSRLLLFAHPCRGNTGFAVNSLSNSESLRAEWWRYPGANYELLVAHVCRGADILGRASYRAVFPNWISYRDDIEVYTGSSTANERWDHIMNELVRVVWESESFMSATLRVDAVYKNALAHVYDTKQAEEGDTLTLIHFMGALEALTTSLD